MSTVARLRSGPKRQTAGSTVSTKAKAKLAAVADTAKRPEAVRQSNGPPRRSRRAAGMPAEEAGASADAEPSVSPLAPRPAIKATRPKPTTAVAQAGAAVVKGAVKQRIAALESAKAPSSLAPSPARRPVARQVVTNGDAKAPVAAPGANFIMSSPKRKARAEPETPQAASPGLLAPESGLASKRRRSEAADDTAATPTRPAAPPGFHSPLLKRVRPSSAATATDSSDDSSAPTPSKRAPQKQQQSRWARRFGDSGKESEPAATQRGETPSSPLKSILSPVFDLLRRVSGIAHDPLGLQRQDSVSSDPDSSIIAAADVSLIPEEASDVFVCAMPGALNAAAAAPPPGSPEANSLTAPPMNPTTLGPHATAPAPAYLANGMQLYLPDSSEVGGADSCSASPVTAGYPETPSKENIPMYSDYSIDAVNDEITALSTVALANISVAGQRPQREVGQPSESDLDLSQISSLADSDADAQYEQYLHYEDDDEEFNPYLFMADLPPIPKEHTLRPYALPRKTRSSPPITLVLDLDETLVHCALTEVDNADLVFPVEYNGLNYDVYCRLRPGYREFLEKASELFEVVVFTASQQVYADRLLNLIDPERRYIRHRLFRDSCVYVNTNYVKDLGILGRDESKMILVDNCPQAFAYQQSNGIPIESWYEDKSDRELMHLMDFLQTLVGDDDVRPKVEAHFKTREKVAEAKKRFHFKLASPYSGSGPIYVRAATKT
ncbi:hypothetical protein GGI02_001217 [Coemansia sp. RSA 2322]|nr:hypothetical protein GGI02_001217 [Coemansia sp. RSA 2322]